MTKNKQTNKQLGRVRLGEYLSKKRSATWRRGAGSAPLRDAHWSKMTSHHQQSQSRGREAEPSRRCASTTCIIFSSIFFFQRGRGRGGGRGGEQGAARKSPRDNMTARHPTARVTRSVIGQKRRHCERGANEGPGNAARGAERRRVAPSHFLVRSLATTTFYRDRVQPFPRRRK